MTAITEDFMSQFVSFLCTLLQFINPAKFDSTR